MKTMELEKFGVSMENLHDIEELSEEQAQNIEGGLILVSVIVEVWKGVIGELTDFYDGAKAGFNAVTGEGTK